jgi:hypothetical protein
MIEFLDQSHFLHSLPPSPGRDAATLRNLCLDLYSTLETFPLDSLQNLLTFNPEESQRIHILKTCLLISICCRFPLSTSKSLFTNHFRLPLSTFHTLVSAHLLMDTLVDIITLINESVSGTVLLTKDCLLLSRDIVSSLPYLGNKQIAQSLLEIDGGVSNAAWKKSEVNLVGLFIQRRVFQPLGLDLCNWIKTQVRDGNSSAAAIFKLFVKEYALE